MENPPPAPPETSAGAPPETSPPARGASPPPEAVWEALLWASPLPLHPDQVASLAAISREEAAQALERLRERYDRAGGGLEIQKVAGGYQICTRPELASYVEKLLRPKPQPLSQAALETLAIVAYLQPVTKAEIENIRGVNSDGVLRTLLERKLVREAGRKDTVGRPLLYGTTTEFLRYLGLEDLGQLPPLESFGNA